jgi:hypothetical protein
MYLQLFVSLYRVMDGSHSKYAMRTMSATPMHMAIVCASSAAERERTAKLHTTGTGANAARHSQGLFYTPPSQSAKSPAPPKAPGRPAMKYSAHDGEDFFNPAGHPGRTICIGPG